MLSIQCLWRCCPLQFWEGNTTCFTLRSPACALEGVWALKSQINNLYKVWCQAAHLIFWQGQGTEVYYEKWDLKGECREKEGCLRKRKHVSKGTVGVVHSPSLTVLMACYLLGTFSLSASYSTTGNQCQFPWQNEHVPEVSVAPFISPLPDFLSFWPCIYLVSWTWGIILTKFCNCSSSRYVLY